MSDDARTAIFIVLFWGVGGLAALTLGPGAGLLVMAAVLGYAILTDKEDDQKGG